MKKRPRQRLSAIEPPQPSHATYLIVVGTATVFAFLPAFGAGFVNFDDDRVIVRNPYLRQPFADAWRWMWTTTFVGHYQPLTWWSLWVDARLGAFRPFAFHATNVALHAAAAALLTATLVRLLRAARATRDASAPAVWLASSAAALFWAIHPLRVESVAWIAERRDPLSILFWMVALYAYLRYAAGTPTREAPSSDPEAGAAGRVLPPSPNSADRRSVSGGGSDPASLRWYITSVAALACSLLAKAWGMSFVVVLVVLDWAVFRRRAWLDKVPYAILGGASAIVAWFAQRNAVDTMIATAQWSWVARTLQACYGLCFYLWKTILPTRLAVLYELPHDWHDMAAVLIPSAALVVAAAVALAAISRRHRAIGAAAIVYVVTLAPVLGFAQSGPQLVADRYAYVSSLPIAALVAAALVLLARRTGLRPLAAACAAGLVAFGVLTFRQTAVWHDSRSLWQHALATAHESYGARFDLGQALRADGRLDEAIDQYRLALALRPDSGNAWYVYGNAMKAKGNVAQAEDAYKHATASADPASVEWLLAHVNLGNLYFNRHRLDDAIAEYRAAVAQLAGRPPTEVAPEPYLYLGMALSDKGDAAGAREALAIALQYPATRKRAQQELLRISETGGR